METKNNKGFSLIEILVAMGLIGVLTAIAVPAYKNYRRGANDTVLKADVGNGYKAYHAWNAVEGNFCKGLKDVGLNGLKTSQTYSSDAFVGFASASDCTNAPSDISHTPGTNGIGNTDCKLDESSFRFAVANKFDGSAVGYSVSHDNSAPQVGGHNYCAKSSTDDTRATDSECHESSAKCGDADNNCAGAATDTAGDWRTNVSLCRD